MINRWLTEEPCPKCGRECARTVSGRLVCSSYDCSWHDYPVATDPSGAPRLTGTMGPVLGAIDQSAPAKPGLASALALLRGAR